MVPQSSRSSSPDAVPACCIMAILGGFLPVLLPSASPTACLVGACVGVVVGLVLAYD